MSQANQAGSPAPDNAYLSQPSGYLLGRVGLFIGLGLLLLAAWFRQTVIVVLLGLLLSAAGVAWLWSRLSLVNVQCERTLSDARVFPGQPVELKIRLANRKLLPLPWVQVDDEVPEALLAPGTKQAPAPRPGCRSLTNTASLLWYTSVTWRYHLPCPKRGYYRLGPVEVSSGDIFGFYPRSGTRSLIDHVIVYPRLYPVTHLDIPSLYPVGETRAERRIFEDPTRAIGVRDYTPSDSLRRIHWKASARHQTLQVKIFEPTTTLTVALFLGVDTFPADGPAEEEIFELGVSTVASVADFLTRKRSPTGLFVNGRLADSGQPARIMPGSGLGQLVHILEALAKVTPLKSSPFEEFLPGEWGSLPWGTTIVLVISKPPAGLPALLTAMKQAGYKTMVLQVGEEDKGLAAYASAWHYIAGSADLSRQGGAW